MNKIYKDEKSKTPMTQMELTEAVIPVFGQRYIDIVGAYEMDRIEGEMCNCNGDGEFVLLPLDDPAVVEGGKRYMTCRKCGSSSHL